MSERAIRNRLVEVARLSELITYGDLGSVVGITNPFVGRKLAPFLKHIDEAEYRAGRPLLSPLVVWKNTRRPGKGFYTLAARFVPYDGSVDEEFWTRQLRRVHNYYQVSDDPGPLEPSVH